MTRNWMSFRAHDNARLLKKAGAMGAIALVGWHNLAGQPAEAIQITLRELISVSITSPAHIKYLYINQQLPYAALVTCTDQYSDDGGAIWHDIGPDKDSPVPTIIWSATIGSFLTFSGDTTVYQAPDGSMVNGEINDAVSASAIAMGEDIYGAPPTVQPDPIVAFDIADSRPSATSQPEAASSDIEQDLKAANDLALDRDSRVEHLKRVLQTRPDNPLNIQLEFRIGNMLLFNPDLKHREPVRPMEALKVFEGIMSRYDHKNYYQSEPQGASDNPQLMIPRSAVLAASILSSARPRSTTRPDDAAKAKEYLELAMKDLQWTYDHRRNDWATAPKPIQVQKFEPNNRFAGRMKFWEDRKKQAASGNADEIMGVTGTMLLNTAVRLYGTNGGGETPDEISDAMKHLIHDFPGTLAAAEAQRQSDQAQHGAVQQATRPSTTP